MRYAILLLLAGCAHVEDWEVATPGQTPSAAGDPVQWAVTECNRQAADLYSIEKCLRDYGLRKKP